MKNAKNLFTKLAAGLLILGTATFTNAASPDAAAHGNKGKELAAAGKLDEAIAEYTKALEISPKDELLYRNRGLVYRANNKFPEAIADFAKAIELAPKSELGYVERGQVLMIQNQFDAALVDYNKAVELNPNNPVCYDRRGFVFYNLKKFEDAIKDYTTSIEKKADNPVIFSRRADAYVAMNQFAQAKTDLETSLTLRPGDFDTTQRLQFVQAKLAPPPTRPVAPAATPKPTPEPEMLTMPMKIGIGVGALVLIIILIIVFSRKKEPRLLGGSSAPSRDGKIMCGGAAVTQHRATERSIHRGPRRQEISLTPESALLACRRFFGERDEVPWSFKTEV